MEAGFGHFTGKATDCTKNRDPNLKGWCGTENREYDIKSIAGEEMSKKVKQLRRIVVSLLVCIIVFVVWAQTYTFNIEKATAHLTEHGRDTSIHCCAWYTMRALHAGGCPAIILPAQWYRYFMPLVQFKEVKQKGYRPITGDVVVFERPSWKNWSKISLFSAGNPCIQILSKQNSFFRPQ